MTPCDLYCNQVSYLDTIHLLLTNQSKFEGGQVRFHFEHWQDITSDPYVLQCVTNCHLELESEPSSYFNKSTTAQNFSLLEQQAIDNELRDFLSKRIIEYSHLEDGDIISPIFILPKKEPGKYRVIFNLKKLNESVIYRKFKLDTLEAAIKLLKPNCFMTSIDLRDTYYSIPIAPEYRKYLKFSWRGVLYQFTVLPMGLTSSPRIFTKVLKPFFATLRARFGFSCLGYIDDSLYAESSYALCQDATLTATKLLINLGFVPHPSKSIFEPTQIIEFLGFLLNTISMTVSLTPKKCETILAKCQQFLRSEAVSIRDVASLIGTLVSTFPGVDYGPLHYRTLERDKDMALKSANGNFDAVMSLSSASQLELHWWVSSLPTACRVINRGLPTCVITTDASGIGWGASMGEVTTQGLWSLEERSLHINVLELLAVQFSLSALLPSVHNQHIRVESDNTTVISYINSMGGCHSVDCDTIAKNIWTWALAQNLWLSAAYIPGTTNCRADKLSREFNPTLEWSLNPAFFDKIVQCFSRPTVDLFASRINYRLPSYVTWKPDPQASFVDAFSVNWAQFTHGYAFPPFCLISRCLQKIVHEKATVTMIVPLWTTQVWFTGVPNLLIELPRVFHVTNDVLSNPLLPGPHPLYPKPYLMACKLSGVISLTTAFHHKLQMSSCLPGGQGHKRNTPCTFTNGPTFVLNGKLIPCLPL